jgi:uncharacterized protein (DUF3820 family)
MEHGKLRKISNEEKKSSTCHDLDTIVGFGKYKGKSLKYIIDKDCYYVEWLRNEVWDKVTLSRKANDYLVQALADNLLNGVNRKLSPKRKGS